MPFLEWLYIFDIPVAVRCLFVRVIYPISMTRCFPGLFMNMNHMNSANYLKCWNQTTPIFLSFNMLLEIEHRTSHLPNKQALCPSFLKNYKVSLKNRGLFVLVTPSLEGTGNFSFATSAPWQYRQVSAYRNYGCICLNPIHWCSKHPFMKSPGMMWSIFLSVDFSTLGLWV